MSVVKKINIDTIEELHQFLSPLGTYKQFFTEKESYLFRGEGSVSYPLNPSLFRSDTIKKLYHSLRKPEIPEDYYDYEEVYQWIEMQSLIKFFRLANNAGISLPDSDILKKSVLHMHDNYAPQGDFWLPDELLDLFSLARHYSFPTRMLDWSDNIYTALYFACSSAMQHRKFSQEDGLTIYALHLSAIFETDFPIRFVHPLYSFNENATAQGGILSYMETENLLKEEKLTRNLPSLKNLSPVFVNRTPLDERLRNHFQKQASVPDGLLHQITINRTILSDLYVYLDSSHYSAEKIFPDLYGVVRKMMEDEVNWTRLQEKERN